MEDKGQEPGRNTEVREQESMRVQKAAYIRQQVEKQRAAEDALLERLLQEQQVIDKLKESMDENMERTLETRQYNREFQERIQAQVYALHGLSADGLRGMREYKNAYYRGCTAGLFLMSVLLGVLCGFLNGFSSEICLFMLACIAMEGALLAQEEKRPLLLKGICKILYLFAFSRRSDYGSFKRG